MYMRKPHANHFRRERPGGFNNHQRRVKTVSKTDIFEAISRSKREKPAVADVASLPVSTRTFADFSLDSALLANIEAKGFTTPTPIQDKAIPAILLQRDIIGMANTGTGKTAAFLIPLIQKIMQDRAQRVLVLAPTRELVVQIHTELREFTRGLSVRSAMLIGGASEWRQEQDLRRDPHFVIATPGRLTDFIRTKRIRLSAYRNVVLDEADRMVDIGFIQDIKYYISLLPVARQSLFFSATISEKVEEIMNEFVMNPVRVSVVQQNIAATIAQDVIQLKPNTTKIDTLYEMLQLKEFEKVLVFGRTKHGVQKVSDALAKRGVKSGAIHGNKRQNQRQYVLEQFARNEIQILLATDVASRGLDIPDVSHVINYDLPETMEDYTHRIGRTGRANKRGIALTFID
jgi:ATP-dependent RNA helicase RhlE